MKRAAAVAIMVWVAGAVSVAGQTVDELSRRQALERYRAGQELMTAERYEQAVIEFSAATELDPMLTLAHYGLGQAYMALKRYASAVLAFSACRDVYMKLSALQQSNVLESQRRATDEIQELREYLNKLRTGQFKGNYEATIQRVEMRIDDLERTRFTNTGRLEIPGEVSLALGSAYYRNGQPVDAEREWNAAIQANPRLGEAHNNLAVRYMMTGRKKEAEEAIKAAERARFRVHPQLKEDVRKMQASR